MTSGTQVHIGRVDELFADNPRSHKMNKSQQGLTQLLRARSNTAKLFAAVEEPFPLRTELVEVCIIVEWCGPIALWRYHRHNVPRKQLLSDAIAVIPLVHHRMGQRLLRRALRKHGGKYWTLMTWPWGQTYRNTGAFIEAARMACGGPTAPRAAQRLCGVPAGLFNAPAAC
jgi:hypothetical protein